MANSRFVSFLNSGNSNIILYDGCEGYVYDGEIHRKWKKLQNGDQVTVTVDLEEGQVECVINGVPQFSYSKAQLKDNTRKWVPYFEMFDQGDCVEWL